MYTYKYYFMSRLFICQYIFSELSQKIEKTARLKHKGGAGMYQVRTDLALEAREKFEDDHVEVKEIGRASCRERV